MQMSVRQTANAREKREREAENDTEREISNRMNEEHVRLVRSFVRSTCV
jgi:hypothetical protein